MASSSPRAMSSKAPNERCCVLSVDNPETDLAAFVAEPWDCRADAVRLIWMHRVAARGARIEQPLHTACKTLLLAIALAKSLAWGIERLGDYLSHEGEGG